MYVHTCGISRVDDNKSTWYTAIASLIQGSLEFSYVQSPLIVLI